MRTVDRQMLFCYCFIEMAESAQNMKQTFEFCKIQSVSGVLSGACDEAVAVGKSIADRAKRLAENCVLLLDFSQVELVDFSFAKEAYRQILCDEIDGKPVYVINALPNILETLEAVIDQEKDVLVFLDKDDKLTIRGQAFSSAYNDTLNALQRNKWMTAKMLADKLDEGITTMNNRLRKLFHWGIISRTQVSAQNGGVQYLYRFAGFRFRFPEGAG